MWKGINWQVLIKFWQLIQVREETLCSGIYKLINSIWNMEELPQLWKEYITVAIYKIRGANWLVIILVY
jgi:hypothetical protein